MSTTTAPALMPIASSIFALAKHVHALIARGLDADDILERLADPSGVGAEMIKRAVQRRDAGKDYLGDTVLTAEPEPEPEIYWANPADFDRV